MNYEDENWVKIYTRDTAGWVALSWQARGIALELARKLPKSTGELSLGRRGLESLGALLRAPWSELEPFVRELLADGCLEYDEAAQIIRDPQHVARQNAVSSGRARTAKWRSERASSAPPVASPAVTESAPSVTSRDDERRDVTERDACVTSRDDERRDVTKEEKEKKEEKEREPPNGGSYACAREGGPDSSGPISDPSTAPPSWWPQVLSTIATSCGVDLPAAESWLRYAGHRNTKRMSATQPDALQWLTTVMVREARDTRERRRSRVPDSRQPMRDPNPEWMRRAASGENDL